MYDVIVIGGGHAGVEAALSSARLNMNTLLVTGNLNMVSSMPCNPSIGGPAKGIVVREIDALGGQMGINIDKTHIQMKMLNVSKGPAVRALRAQADKVEYSKEMLMTLKTQNNLTLLEGYVKRLNVNDKNQFESIEMEDKSIIKSKTVILTTGTFMNSKIMIGDWVKYQGPDGQKASLGLSDSLREIGFSTFRLKTGTPPRVAKDSVDTSKLEIQPGDMVERKFSYSTQTVKPLENQVPCYLTYTNSSTHEIINKNIHRSSMYSGVVEGVGPRYCPSIEDKIVRFNDKPRHQIFLEPESLSIDEIYVQGFSTSLPEEVQEEMIRTIPGLENCVINKYAYAIEYDAIDSTQLWPSLESKIAEGIFCAGQINGTSGYEEAACQGLMAGINASMKVSNKDPLILKRNEAYIGVLIDDLVTKGTQEPYRLLTSRAEYRLLLRHDNADLRLREHGFRVGLVSDIQYEEYLTKIKQIAQEKDRLKNIMIYPKKDVNNYIESLETSALKDRISAYDLLKRPEIKYSDILNIIDEELKFNEEVVEQVEVQIKYEGYINKANKQAEKMLKFEEVPIPKDIDYKSIHNLAIEAKEKLIKVKPLTIGQASRISGVNPADISILLIHLETRKSKS